MSCSSCDPALSVHDNVNYHQDNKRDQQVNTFTLIGSQLVVMVLRTNDHFVVEEKKKTTKKPHRYPSNKNGH